MTREPIRIWSSRSRDSGCSQNPGAPGAGGEGAGEPPSWSGPSVRAARRAGLRRQACGALAGGCCVLWPSTAAGGERPRRPRTGGSNPHPLTLVEWFERSSAPAYGGMDCSTIRGTNPRNRLARCPEIVARCTTRCGSCSGSRSCRERRNRRASAGRCRSARRRPAGPTSLAALVLAGGYSARMRQFKPLLPFAGSTVLERAVATFLDAG